MDSSMFDGIEKMFLTLYFFAVIGMVGMVLGSIVLIYWLCHHLTLHWH